MSLGDQFALDCLHSQVGQQDSDVCRDICARNSPRSGGHFQGSLPMRAVHACAQPPFSEYWGPFRCDEPATTVCMGRRLQPGDDFGVVSAEYRAQDAALIE
jgi:hypothetical protein